MNEVIRNELKNWCETLNIDDLNEYDISVINIILNHYDELIEAGGTAGGKRANKFVEYVNEKEGVCDKELETLTFGEKKDSKRIKRLKDRNKFPDELLTFTIYHFTRLRHHLFPYKKQFFFYRKFAFQ